ncbi:hypothetical protein [Microbacterium gorillae]|uniref:hypothetical protein n=1 Tax=Microbacterium gorillae TaxID=1231063 RepID=UPI000590D637|nr:hypothetical protein [Microbacterium gorillae]
MGLFGKAKDAYSSAAKAATAQQDWAAQAAAAQQLANDHLAAAGYTDGSPVTVHNAAQVNAAAQADHDLLNAYGQELNRIIAVGRPGSGIITGAVDTGERTSGYPWFQLDVQVTLEGSEPYVVAKREMISPQTASMFAVGTTHGVAVDPTDPQKIAFTS